MSHEWHRDGFTISTDKERIDIATVHAYLTQSYWAEGIPAEIVRRSIEHSLAFGIYHGERQVGFARVITDRATYAYIGDVFVLEEFQGRGLGKWLMEVIISHADLQGLRRWSLATRDAHGLYRQFGFANLRRPENHMEIHNPDVYKTRESVEE
ncbi:MAG TPA: GNAT family N-acetyltransferase [Blastocatellia bacterium]|jgi:GNAT superfamily N-acetyltransferase